MHYPAARGINRQGVDAAFAVEESRKSQLLLEGQLLRAQRQSEAAANKFAEAAVLEEGLRDACLTHGLREKAFVHGFSAASCWAQAGDFHHAISVCHELLAHSYLPARLRQRIAADAKTLDIHRAQWYEELVMRDPGSEGA
jgi:hypothetical protein